MAVGVRHREIRVHENLSLFKQKKGIWTPFEDALLLAFVAQHGASDWNSAQYFFPGLCRSGKSCRLRYLNNLCPTIRRHLGIAGSEGGSANSNASTISAHADSDNDLMEVLRTVVPAQPERNRPWTMEALQTVMRAQSVRMRTRTMQDLMEAVRTVVPAQPERNPPWTMEALHTVMRAQSVRMPTRTMQDLMEAVRTVVPA